MRRENINDSDILDNIYKLLGKLNLLKKHQSENKDLIKKLEKRLSEMEDIMGRSNTYNSSAHRYNIKIIHNLKLKILILSSYIILDILIFLLTEKGILSFITLLFS